MRINKVIAFVTGISRRKSDSIIQAGRVTVDGKSASIGQEVSGEDIIRLDNRIIDTALAFSNSTTTIMLHKPIGYVVSRHGQGSQTIYDLLPTQYRKLKPIGRLDKNSSGLLLLSNDGQLAFHLTHPSKQKSKIYEIVINKKLDSSHQKMISKGGVRLEDGISRLTLDGPHDKAGKKWRVTMQEGRNRQIRRTFQRLGYDVLGLQRTQFGDYKLGKLHVGKFTLCS